MGPLAGETPARCASSGLRGASPCCRWTDSKFHSRFLLLSMGGLQENYHFVCYSRINLSLFEAIQFRQLLASSRVFTKNDSLQNSPLILLGETHHRLRVGNWWNFVGTGAHISTIPVFCSGDLNCPANPFRWHGLVDDGWLRFLLSTLLWCEPVSIWCKWIIQNHYELFNVLGRVEHTKQR